MDINVRVSTGTPTVCPQHCATGNTVGPNNNIPSSTANISTPTITPPATSMQNGANSVAANGVVSSQASNNMTPSSTAVDLRLGNQSNNQDWAKELVSSMKSVFESFVASMTKLLENLFGPSKSNNLTTKDNALPTNSAAQLPATASSTSPAVTNQTSRTMEAFKDHALRNLVTYAQGTISEDKLQEAVVMYQLYQKDMETENIFKTKLAEAKTNGQVGDSAIKMALIETEKSGKISRWESDWVYSLSHKASQFDGNINDISGDQSQSSKMQTLAAIQQAERSLISIATGIETPINRTVQ